MTIEIRMATRRDVPEMVAISNSYVDTTHINFAVEPESIEAWIAQWDANTLRFPAFTAIDDDAVVGFARSMPWKSRCAYEHACEVSVYVTADRHHLGIGAELYASLLPALARAGFRSAMAGIALPNDASMALHESCGFRPVGIFREVGRKFDQWWDVGYWQRVFAD